MTLNIKRYPADDSEAEFQPDDEQENIINKDLKARIVVDTVFVQAGVAGRPL